MGLLGGAASQWAIGQTRPCPVSELSAGGTPVATACGRSALEVAAGSLTAGQSTTALGDSGLSSDALFTIQWSNRFHYDHTHARAHLLGKNADSQGRERSNCLYDVTTNTWIYEIFGGSELGHVYESFAYNPNQGEVFTGRWNGDYLQRWTSGTPLSSWTTTASFGSTVNPDTQTAVCWHPNLFGLGDGGVLALRSSGTTASVIAWRRASNSWTTIAGTTHTISDANYISRGAIEYVRSAGHAIATFSSGNGKTFIIRAGNGGSAAAATETTGTPMPCRYAGGGNNVGILIDDPSGAAGPYILEKGGSNRVWKLINGAWSLRNYTHPLPGGAATTDTNWVVASVYPLGVFWARSNRSSMPSRLWRPND